MSLRSLALQMDYRSGADNLLRDFFRPTLREAREYWRAVGYFSSSALDAFGTPLGEFLKNDGRIRLITSVELSEADLLAIKRGTQRQEVCTSRLEDLINTEFVDGIGDGTTKLVRLLELGRLDIKIAVPKTGTGIYHEKVGLFIDDTDFVAFTGSSNESRNAFEVNRECIDVYKSWSSEKRAFRKKAHFEEMWHGRDAGVEVFTFPEAAKTKLLRVCRHRRTKTITQRDFKEQWRHQDEAVRAFLKDERGVLDMATGTGKTRIAIKILEALAQRDAISTVIVSTDGNDLLDQWYKQLIRVRSDAHRRPRVFRHYGGHKETSRFLLNPHDAILISSRKPLAMALRKLSPVQAHRTFLIHDEVHKLGSPGNCETLAGLSDDIRFRLGLSATPERHYDKEGNDFIREHIGPVLQTFGLSEAIERGILAPFNYHPISYSLTDNDRERISRVYKKRSAREASGQPMTKEEVWIEIARVYKTSESKLPLLDDFLANNQELLSRCIVFTETREFACRVMDIVHKYHPGFHSYFAGEDHKTLQKFARGDLQCLITCHRLSEGIDIRSLNSVILLSSDRSRLETIQRIGRCLRSDPTDPTKVANIVDFVHDRTASNRENPDETRCQWLSELSVLRAET